MESSVPSPATVREIFDRLGPPGTPFSTPEIAAAFDCSDRTIYNRLDALVEAGKIETKKVGAKGRVWWKPVHDDRHGGVHDPPSTDSATDHNGKQPHLHASGEMAERIRVFDWTETPPRFDRQLAAGTSGHCRRHARFERGDGYLLGSRAHTIV